MLYQLGVNPPADIASGRIAEVRSRSMSCNCMTRTSQQECRGILELWGKDLYPFRYKIMGGGLDYGKQKYDNCVRFGSVRFGSVRFGRSIVPFF